MKKISPNKLFLLSFITGLFIIIMGSCVFAQTIPFSSLPKSASSGSVLTTITTGTNATITFTPTLPISKWTNDANYITRTGVSATSPLFYNSSTGIFTVQPASTSQNGVLSSTDWNTFNNKQPALGFTAENIANKVTTFGTLNNTLYPSTQAVSNYVTGFNYLTANQTITFTASGDVTGTASGATSISPVLTLATVNSNTGTTGGASTTNTTTVNGKGLITAIGTIPIQITESQVTNLTGDLATKSASFSTSAGLAGLLNDETGTGLSVFNTSPTFTTQITTPLIYGSSASGGTLTIGSTSNATKGKILFGTSAYDEVNNRLGIGNTSPATAIDVTGMVTASTGFNSNGVNTLSQINGFTNNISIYGKLTNGQVVLGYNAGTAAVTINSVGVNQSVGNFSLSTVGSGIQIKSGTNATVGTATLSAGTVTVSTNKVTANSIIMISDQGGSITNLGIIYISAKTAGTSFVITSSNILDASTVGWWILEPL